MKGVDFCITTMNRPEALERLLISIAESHPEASIHIADQSVGFDPRRHERMAARLQETGLRIRPTIHRLPFDCGVSVARNHLVDSSTGRYKLILDDDFAFTDQTDVEAMTLLLEARPDAGVVGGSVARRGKVVNVGTRFEKSEGSLRQLAADSPFEEHSGIRFQQTDCVPNFILARRDIFGDVRWDPDLKTSAEHFDFFLRLRATPYVVLYAPDTIVDHPPAESDIDYGRLRRRGEFVKRMLVKHDAARLKAINGTVMELHPDGHLIGYCELPRQTKTVEHTV